MGIGKVTITHAGGWDPHDPSTHFDPTLEPDGPRLVPIEDPHPGLRPCTIATTPEEWAVAHRTVLPSHEVDISAWGALCNDCGAVWTRDPAAGGEDRRRV